MGNNNPKQTDPQPIVVCLQASDYLAEGIKSKIHIGSEEP